MKENILGEIKKIDAEIKRLQSDQSMNDQIKILSEKKNQLEQTIGVKKNTTNVKIKEEHKPQVIEYLKKMTEKLNQYNQQLTESLKSEDFTSPEVVASYTRSLGALEVDREDYPMTIKGQTRPCGLSHVEMYLIQEYTGSLFASINTALRKGPSHKNYDKVKIQSDIINQGLDKIASHEGLVKRGAYLPKEVENAHCLGCVITYEAFTSTSASHVYPSKHQFFIKSKTGKHIAPISHFRAEDEVLFKSATKFKILDIKKSGGTTKYTMEEIED